MDLLVGTVCVLSVGSEFQSLGADEKETMSISWDLLLDTNFERKAGRFFFGAQIVKQRHLN